MLRRINVVEKVNQPLIDMFRRIKVEQLIDMLRRIKVET